MTALGRAGLRRTALGARRETKKARLQRALFDKLGSAGQCFPLFCDFANVAVTELVEGCGFAAALFLGLRISLFERCWPLGMANLLRVGGRVALDLRRVRQVFHTVPASARRERPVRRSQHCTTRKCENPDVQIEKARRVRAMAPPRGGFRRTEGHRPELRVRGEGGWALRNLASPALTRGLTRSDTCSQRSSG